jgi:hypothetical protein
VSEPFWHYPPSLPEDGRRIVAVHEDGDHVYLFKVSGDVLLDADDGDFAMWSVSHIAEGGCFAMWAYLPNGFSLQFEMAGGAR